MPVVSVIIPTYNCAPYVCMAVKSALVQDVDLEVIVVDDGSTDDTVEALRCFFADRRVRYIYQSNRGLPGARNAGALASHSEYLAFLDADDELRPNALKQMLRGLSESGAAWCLIDILKRRIDSDDVERTLIPAGNPLYAILQDDFIRRGMFFRRAAFVNIGMYDESMKNREDWDLNIRMFRARMSYTYVAAPLYLYTWRAGSITTGNRSKVLMYTEKVLRKHHKVLSDDGNCKAQTIYSELMWGLARDYLYETRDVRRFLRCALQSLRYDFSVSRVLHPISYRIGRLKKSSPCAIEMSGRP